MKLKNLTKFIIIILIAFFIFSSCNRNKKDDKTLIFWHVMGGRILGDALNDLVDKYNATNPEYKVVAIHKGKYSSLIQSIMASIPADMLPDITQAYESWITKMDTADVVVCLDDYLEDKTILDDFYPVLYRNSMYDGRFLSMPFNKSVYVMYYNKDMFELHDKTPPKTWDEFYDLCKYFTKDEDNDGNPERVGFAFIPSNGLYLTLFKSFGGEISDDPQSFLNLDSPAGLKAFTFLHDLLHKERSIKRFSGYEFQNDFAQEKAAMIITSCVSRSYFEKKLNFKLGIAPLPGDKVATTVLQGTNLVICKSNPERERAAFKFLKFLMEPENVAFWAIRTKYVPVRRSALETEIYKDALEKDPLLAVPLEQLNESFFEPRVIQWYRCRTILSDTIDKVVTDRKKPKEGLEYAIKKIKKEIHH
ncbi:ABC transporter substrate-binding protein [Candidatus Dependentiae bacterium]|nr:ABC transporter substrate-binding protein [Candidatus Dependentiae bacterium]